MSAKKAKRGKLLAPIPYSYLIEKPRKNYRGGVCVGCRRCKRRQRFWERKMKRKQACSLRRP